MTITPQKLVEREVHHCVSYLVYALAQGYGSVTRNNPQELRELCEQAMELSCPIDDWEEAAIQEGWIPNNNVWTKNKTLEESDGEETGFCESARDACEFDGIEPYQREIFEHWIVSDWLGRKLEAKGERVDFDFANLTVWGRTTTGQAIYMDRIIEEICEEMQKAA